MRVIITQLKNLSRYVQGLFGKARGRFVDPRTQKIASPAKIKKMSILIMASFAVTLLLVTVLTGGEFVGSGMGDFQKQKGVKFGVTRAEIDKSINAIDPLANFNAEVTPQQQCEELHSRVKLGEKLTTDEYAIYKKCLLDNTIFGLNDMQKKALLALSDPDSNLSTAARALLEKVANGTLDPQSEEAKIAEALLSGDPLAREVAQRLLEPGLSDAEREALLGFLDGKVSPEVARALLSDDPKVRQMALALNDAIKAGDYDKQAELRNAIAEAMPASGAGSDNGALQNEAEAIKVALDDMLAERDRVQARMNEIKPFIPGIEKKLAAGIPLTASEQSMYDEYRGLQNKLSQLDTAIAQTNSEYQKILIKVNADVGAAYANYNHGNKEIIEEYNPNRVTKGPNKVKKTEEVKKVSKVTPSEYELIKRIRSARMSDDYEGSLYPNVDGSTFNQKEIVASALSSGRMSPLKNYNLPLDLKIPCVVETEVFVSSNDAEGRRVICNVLDNIYNPENNEILIPKGSKAIGVTSQFDPNTKLMQVAFNKVRVGKDNFDIGFSLVDGTGRQGLPGGVINTRNKRITAAVLTDFAAGVTQFFSQYAQQRMLQNGVDSLNLQDSVVNGAFNGVSTGLSKISEILAQDLQNSPDIFYSPAGMKMILIPN